jgi:uncharacterized protein YeaO (DUF488 family)
LNKGYQEFKKRYLEELEKGNSLDEREDGARIKAFKAL